MSTFPALQSGVPFQFPFRRTWAVRKMKNEYLDGRESSYRDRGGARVSWVLEYSDLTSDERITLETFFAACRGRLYEFSFSEPASNLFSYSEDLTHASWTTTPGISVASCGEDASGRYRVFQVVNASPVEGAIRQEVAGGGGTYCLSGWLKSASGEGVRLRVGPGEADPTPVHLDDQWRRVWTASAGSGSRFEAGLSIPSGHSVELYGLQLEAQLSPSAYKPTTGAGGCYERTRFDQDALTFIETAPGRYSTRIRLTAQVTE